MKTKQNRTGLAQKEHIQQNFIGTLRLTLQWRHVVRKSCHQCIRDPRRFLHKLISSERSDEIGRVVTNVTSAANHCRSCGPEAFRSVLKRKHGGKNILYVYILSDIGWNGHRFLNVTLTHNVSGPDQPDDTTQPSFWRIIRRSQNYNDRNLLLNCLVKHWSNLITMHRNNHCVVSHPNGWNGSGQLHRLVTRSES